MQICIFILLTTQRGLKDTCKSTKLPIGTRKYYITFTLTEGQDTLSIFSIGLKYKDCCFLPFSRTNVMKVADVNVFNRL